MLAKHRSLITWGLGGSGVGLCFLMPGLHHGTGALIAHIGAAALVVIALIINIAAKEEARRDS